MDKDKLQTALDWWESLPINQIHNKNVCVSKNFQPQITLRVDFVSQPTEEEILEVFTKCNEFGDRVRSLNSTVLEVLETMKDPGAINLTWVQKRLKQAVL